MSIQYRRRLPHAIAFLSLGVFLLGPGCVIRIGSGGIDGDTDPSLPPDPSGTAGGGDAVGGNGGAGGASVVDGAAAFQDVDPQQLALLEAKASITTAYLVAATESMGLDPTTLDQAALEQLMLEYLPAASADAELWLSTLDPSTIPLAGTEPNYACYSEYHCDYSSTCKVNKPAVPHICWVMDCGKSNCSLCPSWVADLLKSLVITTWCSYVCTDKSTKLPIAIGAAGISSFKGYFVGPICKAL